MPPVVVWTQGARKGQVRSRSRIGGDGLGRTTFGCRRTRVSDDIRISIERYRRGGTECLPVDQDKCEALSGRGTLSND